MNSTSLLALIVDQHSGELTPEVIELLEAHLSENAAARAEAERIRKVLALTEQTVMRHPELARVEAVPLLHDRRSSERRRSALPWLAKAASIALLAAVTGASGFLAGQKKSASTAAAPVAADNSARLPRRDSPWARYRIAPDPGGGGMQIVRVESAKLSEGSWQ